MAASHGARVKVAQAALAAVALAAAVGGESSVGRALTEGGKQASMQSVSEQSMSQQSTSGQSVSQQRMVPTAASRSAVRPALVADLPQAQRAELLALPARLAPDGAGIDVGYPDAPLTLTLFEDFRCSVSAAFEFTQGATLADLATRHQVLLRYVMDSSLDRRLPGPGALLATNAARSALAHGGFPLFHALLFANQPSELVDGFTEPRLLEIASAVPGLRGPAFDAEVHGLWYRDWVARAQQAYADAHVINGTPSMLADGRTVDLGAHPELVRSPAALRAFVQRGGVA
ncbi:DsbA family protein [Streptacidiphilus sp. EB129]|uniref:DsbA family protein n=1 Tax=Streptacidiphilus sp. EB129 TaxID=3156262 RepID=UPI003512D3BF